MLDADGRPLEQRQREATVERGVDSQPRLTGKPAEHARFDRRAPIARQRQQDFDLVVLDKKADELDVEILAARHRARPRVVAPRRVEKKLARQRDGAPQRVERGFPAKRIEDREDIAGFRARRELTRDGVTRCIVRLSQALANRGDELRPPAIAAGARRKDVVGRNAQPEQPVRRARAVRQPIEERQIGG